MVLGIQLGEQTAFFQSLLLFGGLLVVLMLAAVFSLYLRWRMRRIGSEDAGVLSLDELRRLRDNGTLTVAEYERLRAKTLDAVRTGVGSESSASVR